MPGRRRRFELNIRNRLIVGFAALLLVLATAVGITLWKVRSVDREIGRIIDLRVPTAFSSAALINDINASLAHLRGWMLTGKTGFKAERAAVWNNIGRLRDDMDRLSANWTNPANVAAWADFKVVLNEFRGAQERVEDIANTPDETPATKLLVEKAAPLAAVMVNSITTMIDAESELGATAERKALLGTMADVRGTTGIALASIRAFLLTGDEGFREDFEVQWATNEKRISELSAKRHLLSAAQMIAFAELSKVRAEFAPLPGEMLRIRGSEKWNMANYLLVTEAIPRADKLLTILAGAKTEDASRVGGMVENQRFLLANDADDLANDTRTLISIEWVLLLSGLFIAIVVALFTARSLVNPIRAMTDAMGRLAEGDVTIDVPAREREDEIGEMAQAVQVFKENAIRMGQLEKTRREAERELRRSESSLAEAQRIARLGNWDLNLITGELHWSDEAFRILHLDRESFDGTTASFYRRVHPDEREHVRQAADAAINAGKPYSLDHRIVLPNGEERTVHEQAEVEFDDSGKPLVMRGTVQDITERKLAEERMRRLEQRFSDAMDASPSLIGITGVEDGKFVYANGSWLSTFGYRRDEVIGKTPAELDIWTGPKGRASLIETLKKKGAARNLELELRMKSGEVREFLSSVQTIEIEGRDHLLFFSQDITERKRVEEALRLTQFSFDRASDAIFWLDSDGCLTYVNDTACRMLGYPLEELLGSNLGDIDPDVSPAEFQRSWDRIGARGSIRFETRYRAKDGTMIPVDVSSFHLKYGDTELACSFSRDITERKLAEDMSRQHERELAQLLRRNTVGEMASALAHEINQPLASIVNYSRGCTRRFRSGKWKSDEILNALDQISEQTERASSIIRNIGEFIRSPEPKRTPADINDLVRSVATLTEAEFRIHGVKVIFNLADGLPPVSVSVIEIEQVILNLMMNSLDAMKETSRSDREIVIQTSLARRDAVEVAVRDVGTGLDGGISDKVFDPYFTTKENGMGLGLSISRTIIDAHGGKLSADRNAGCGATFRFTIPAQREIRGRVG